MGRDGGSNFDSDGDGVWTAALGKTVAVSETSSGSGELGEGQQ
jgi:hypothetical protein